jgi:hypothetical protein
VGVTFISPADYKIYIDATLAAEGKDGTAATPGITGIRFGTKDGPGNYQSLPFVYYIDNFTILSGTMLSIGDLAQEETFPATISGAGGQLTFSDIAPDISDIRVLATDGRLLWTSPGGYRPSVMTVPVKEPVCIVLLRDRSGKIFFKKTLVLR